MSHMQQDRHRARELYHEEHGELDRPWADLSSEEMKPWVEKATTERKARDAYEEERRDPNTDGGLFWPVWDGLSKEGKERQVQRWLNRPQEVVSPDRQRAKELYGKSVSAGPSLEAVTTWDKLAPHVQEGWVARARDQRLALENVAALTADQQTITAEHASEPMGDLVDISPERRAEVYRILGEVVSSYTNLHGRDARAQELEATRDLFAPKEVTVSRADLRTWLEVADWEDPMPDETDALHRLERAVGMRP